jgi:hypothetical protein
LLPDATAKLQFRSLALRLGYRLKRLADLNLTGRER